MKRLVRTILSAVLLTLAGCAGVSPEQRQMLDRSLEQYQAKKYSESEAGLNRFLSEVKNDPQVAEAYYLRGLVRVQLGQAAAARDDFEKVLIYPPSPGLNFQSSPVLLAKTQAALGDLDTAEDHPPAAITHYAAALRHLPLGPPTDQVLYWMGVNQQVLGQWQEASLSFSRLLEEYRTSPLAESARTRLRYQAFVIRLGTYRDLAAAQRAAQDLRKELPEADAAGDFQDGRPVAVVQTGHYRTLAEARAALPNVRHLVPQAVIVPCK